MRLTLLLYLREEARILFERYLWQQLRKTLYKALLHNCSSIEDIAASLRHTNFPTLALNMWSMKDIYLPNETSKLTYT